MIHIIVIFTVLLSLALAFKSISSAQKTQSLLFMQDIEGAPASDHDRTKRDLKDVTRYGIKVSSVAAGLLAGKSAFADDESRETSFTTTDSG